MSMNDEMTLHMRLPASFEHLAMLEPCITTMLRQAAPGIDTTLRYNIILAVHEACANIVEHAYQGQPDGQIAMACMLTDAPARLEIELHDTGQSFDLDQVTLPEPGTVQEGGYGLFLIYALLDEVHYLPQPGGNRWRLVKYLA
jgi:serine/threonine-protein kinase RsbW